MRIERLLGALALWGMSMLAACEPATDDGGLPPGDVARGELLVEQGLCKSCHANDLAGSPEPIGDTMIYSSNITPDDATGIGMWTDKELDDAMRLGKDNDNEAICDPMPVYYNLTAQESADIIAYMRSVPPVNREVMDSVCH